METNINLTEDREYCHNLLKQYTKSESLLKHAYAVECCVKAYAHKYGENVQYWGNVALLHDFDYEMFPSAEEHPFKGSEILKQLGFPEDFRNAILSHADYSGVPRETLLSKVLYACDELAGFITAVSYVRPGKSVSEVDVRSVRKKLKDKAFAKAINREDIVKGAELLGIELDNHISFCIDALKTEKDALGL